MKLKHPFSLSAGFLRRRRHLRTVVLALSSIGMAGCAVGPDYVKPQLDVPAAYKDDGRWKTAQPMDESPRGAWWTAFRDSRLNALMDRMERQSPTIAQAEAQYREAQALLRQAQAGLFPTLTASASGSRGASGSGSNGTTINPATGLATTTNSGQSVSTTYNAGLTASWEADVWGGVRRSIESGRAAESASASQLAAVRLSSEAQLVSAYLQLLEADVQLRQLQQNEAALLETLTITRNQFNAGIISDANLALAESQWQSARTQTLDKQLTRDQLEHAVAAALGVAPANFSLPAATTPDRPYLPRIPAGLPSALLERRPDIAVAERNVAAANARIGVAQAAFFPSLTLSATGGFRSNGFADWFSIPNRIWSLGPQLAATLFDGGLRRAQSDEAIATYDATVAAYCITVLSAFQAVEDNLAAQASLAQQAALQTAALAAAQRSETITLNQYRAGTVNYINVLTAQSTRVSAENTLSAVRNRQYINTVALIAAIGGNW